ncbi:mismatch-specific DNA-glycosylase, partial [Streptomyces sp. NPDC003832]
PERPGLRHGNAPRRDGHHLRKHRRRQRLRVPGITNVVARATARADELSAEEYREGGRLLAAKVDRLKPDWLAVVGVTAYRAAFGDRKAQVGPQERTFGETRVWVLPNPSGLNAHWTARTMAQEYARLRVRADRSS